MIHSFDVFDTCLCRTCGDPEQVFVILARIILGDDATDTQISDFRYLRKTAEIVARRKRKDKEITIEEIYNEINLSYISKYTKEEILEEELRVEESVLCPINKSLERIDKIHNKGGNVLFITDMYLPSLFIKKILQKFCFWKEGDLLYVSSEQRASKHEGLLFSNIKKELNRKNSLWLHHGDSFRSDFIMPIMNGIIPNRLTGGYTYYEKILKRQEYNLCNNVMHCVAGISRSIVLSRKADNYIQFAADLIAPTYVSFVYQVLKESQRRGISRLYFLSRDGYIFYLIAQQFQKIFSNIELHYLFVSRKALYFPSIDIINVDNLKNIVPVYLHNSGIEAADYLHISNTEYLDIVGDGDISLDKLLNSKEVLELISKRWIEQRNNCLGYLIQERVASCDDRTAIVDVRGTRKCQQSINQLLTQNGYRNIFAFYLEVDSTRIFPNTPDEYEAYIFGDYSNEVIRRFSGRSYLFEKYFCINTFKRVSGYMKNSDGTYGPTFDYAESTSSLDHKIQEINEKVCMDFANKFLICKLGKYSKQILFASITSVAKFSSNPQKDYLSVLDGVKFSETQYKSANIVVKKSLHNLYKKDYMWFDATLAYNSSILFKSYKLLRFIKSTIIRFIY